MANRTLPTITPIQTGDQRVDRFEQNVASAVNPVLRLGTTMLQGRDLAPTAPADGQVLAWNAADGEWEPDSVAGVGAVTAVTASAPLASSGGSTPNITITDPLPVANGGTGQTTAGAALSALGGVPTTRTITAGTGLSGGGDLSANRSLAIANVGTAGTYGDASHVAQITTNAQGQVTGVTEVAITACGPQRPALVGDELLVYRCNDASSPIVNSGSETSVDLPVTGTVLQYQTAGPFAPGLAPSGDANNTSVQIYKSVSFTLPTDFTLSVWFQTFRFGQGTGGQTLIEISGNIYFTMSLKASTVSTIGAIISTTDSANHTMTIPAWATQLTDNNWGDPHMLAMTYTSGNLRLYLDGILIANDGTTGTLVSDATHYLSVGSSNPAIAGDAFAGRIWEARLNPSVLSEATIRQQYAAGMGWQA